MHHGFPSSHEHSCKQHTSHTLSVRLQKRGLNLNPGLYPKKDKLPRQTVQLQQLHLQQTRYTHQPKLLGVLEVELGLACGLRSPMQHSPTMQPSQSDLVHVDLPTTVAGSQAVFHQSRTTVVGARMNSQLAQTQDRLHNPSECTSECLELVLFPLHTPLLHLLPTQTSSLSYQSPS